MMLIEIVWTVGKNNNNCIRKKRMIIRDRKKRKNEGNSNEMPTT